MGNDPFKQIEPDILTEVHLLPTSETGRPGPLPDTYFGCLMVLDDDRWDQCWDVRLRLYEVGEIQRPNLVRS